MSDRPWKAFERKVGQMIGGARAWSNSGEEIDCESERFIAQCKHVQRMSLEEVTSLVETMDTHPKAIDKMGLVCLKVRRGKGKPSPTLVVMSSDTFLKLTDALFPLYEVTPNPDGTSSVKRI